jgi:hypothetical protein
MFVMGNSVVRTVFIFYFEICALIGLRVSTEFRFWVYWNIQVSSRVNVKVKKK